MHKLFIIFLIFSCINTLFAQEEPNFALAGFASETTGTTGGKNGERITVSTGTELQIAIKNHKNSNTPLVILVDGLINLENSADLEKIEIKDVKNLSIIGSVNGADFDGIGLKIRRVSNFIIRNISIHHVLSGEKDCINIEGPADHIWIDHCELYNEYGDVDGDGDEDDNDKDYYDGLLDIKRDAEYVTYSWNYLHGSWKTSLVGSSESDTYDRKLTIHHNYYENCYSRLPLFRGGTGHVFNNYFNNIVSSAINTRIGACIRIEKNYFENVHNPWVSAFSDVLGSAEIIDNVLINCTFDHSRSDVSEPLVCVTDIPYIYNSVLDTSTNVKNLVQEYSGVGKLTDPTFFEIAGSETTPNAIAEINLSNTRIFPNPIDNSGTIQFKLKEKQQVNFEIYDAIGNLVTKLDSDVYNAGYNQIEFNTQEFNTGLYFIKITNVQSCFCMKFIKN